MDKNERKNKQVIKMLTAVTTDNPVLNSLVSQNFGRCAFFILFDENKNSTEIMKNPFSNSTGIAAGVQLAHLLIEKKVDSIITSELGKGPLMYLLSAGIKIYQCDSLTALEAVELLAKNKLAVMDTSTLAAGNRLRKRYRKSDGL